MSFPQPLEPPQFVSSTESYFSYVHRRSHAYPSHLPDNGHSFNKPSDRHLYLPLQTGDTVSRQMEHLSIRSAAHLPHPESQHHPIHYITVMPHPMHTP
jgi:hypothetical protein